MINRRPPDFHALRFVFALALLLLGLVLPFASTVRSRPAAGFAAAVLPTARVQMPTPRPLAPPPTMPAADGPPLASAAGRPTTAGPPAARLPSPIAQPRRVSTPTNTPVPLGMVPAHLPIQAVPTLFPTEPSPLAPLAAAPLAPPAPILMYHYIRAVDPAIDQLGYNLSVTPDDFERQVAWLHEQGYHGVRMDTLARCLAGAAICPPKPIALTFDDGYADAFTTVLPALQRYQMSATFYIISGVVGQPGYMSWEQLAALRDAGMEIGAHTINHLDLTALDWATAGSEIAQSKADLEQQLGIDVKSFCYPTGLYNGGIEEQVRAAGYTSATTTRWDVDYSDILALPRRRIAGGTTLDGFAAIVGSL